MNKLRHVLYTVLTTLIIVLAYLRDRAGRGTYRIRCDRTLPWEQPQDALALACCDCGLTHFIVVGNDVAPSVTPIRPEQYQYRSRLGANAYIDPDLDLGIEVCDMLMGWHPRRHYIWGEYGLEGQSVFAPQHPDWRRKSVAWE